LRADIERIRGVASGEVLRALVERGMVRVAGRAELPGAPLYYGTTTRFLEVFGLRDLAERPRDGEALRQPS
jgi:segregation and condensation protein B